MGFIERSVVVGNWTQQQESGETNGLRRVLMGFTGNYVNDPIQI